MQSIVVSKTSTDIQLGKFTLTPTGLVVSGKPSLDEYLECGDKLKMAEGAIQWGIGDYLVFFENDWGEMYAQATTEEQAATWRHYKWVSSKVDLCIRIHNLSWSHHLQVADLKPSEQTKWLKRSIDKKWNANELRNELGIHKRLAEYANGKNGKTPNTIQLSAGDFREKFDQLEDESVDFIFTDPPYDEKSIPLYTDLARIGARVLKPGGSLIAYAGHYALPRILAAMSEHLRYWWMIALEHSGSSARLPGKWVFVGWKPLVWFVKGHHSHADYVSDIFKSSQPDKVDHDWQQDQSEAAYYINHLTVAGDLVADPFLGSGTTLIAAHKAGRRGWGCDIDPRNVEIAKGALSHAK